MAKLKSQKEKDLAELTEKLKSATAVVMTGYSGTTVKDLDKFRNALRKENVFSKVYKLPLVKKALAAVGVTAEVNYKTPVILAITEEEESAPARIIKGLIKDIKSIVVLEGLLGKDILSKAQIEALGSLPSKDQLRSQFMSVLNGPMSAFARAINALAEKKAVPSAPVVEEKPAEVAPVAEASAPIEEAPAAPASAEPAAA